MKQPKKCKKNALLVEKALLKCYTVKGKLYSRKKNTKRIIQMIKREMDFMRKINCLDIAF